jgi:phage head maturation protease
MAVAMADRARSGLDRARSRTVSTIRGRTSISLWAIARTSYAADAIAMLLSGLAIGLSPGFRIPPERAVKEAEKVEEEPVEPDKGMNGAIIRTVLDALLFELSIVTMPAYEEAQVEARSWVPSSLKIKELGGRGFYLPLKRWRA